MTNRIKCGRCASEFVPEIPELSNTLILNAPVKCPLCGYSAKDVNENKKENNKKILKG